uniref:Uncharacterized protein n=1 Tax=viral metagenome TaxID=1070528 RepID=A0A6C0C8K0_9ZZZZ
MQHYCKNCNHKCHCRFESFYAPTPRYCSYINQCPNKTIDNLLYGRQYVYPYEIKTYHGNKYLLSYKEENRIIRVDESDHIEVTHANHRIDKVQTGTRVEYHEQNISGYVGSKPIRCTTKMPQIVPTIQDIYVPIEGTVYKKVAIYLHTVDACKCNKCDCGAAQEEQERRLIEKADKKSKRDEDRSCCTIL